MPTHRLGGAGLPRSADSYNKMDHKQRFLSAVSSPRWRTVPQLVLTLLLLLSVVPVQAEPLLQGQLQITSPEMGAQVRGMVPIVGSAAHPEFQYYKIEYEPGTNPGQWILIGATHETPIINGQLEVWNTNAIPDGIYNLRLRLVKRDGNYNDFVVRQLVVANSQPTSEPSPTTQSAETSGATATPRVTSTPRPTATLQIIAPAEDIARPTPTTTPTLSGPARAQTLPLDPSTWGQSFMFGALAMGTVFGLLGIVFGLRRLL